jgi:trans-aconitate methyltransferase
MASFQLGTLVDDSLAPLLTNGFSVGGKIETSALASGGYATSWISDLDDDETGDVIAVQRFNADGTPNGGIVTLGHLPDAAIASICGQGSAYSLDALANGGYAVSYTLPPVTSYFNRILNGGPSVLSAALIGKPTELRFALSGTASSYTVVLRGLDSSGTVVDLALTPDSTGSVYLTDSQLAQFANPERLSLRVTGLATGATLNIMGNAFEAWNFFGDSPTTTTTASVTLPTIVTSAVTAGIGTPAGRVESFHITSLTPFSGATPTYSFSVLANTDVLQSLGLTPGTVLTVDGLTVTVLANWVMTITGAIAPDANGNIAVPAALLQALGTHDASIALVVSGLAGGSTLAADIVVRTPTVITPGIHSAIYDATGHLIADHTIDDSSAPLLTNSFSVGGKIETSALASGGYATSWIGNLDGDETGDVIAVQRFNADGTPSGAIVTLGHLPDAAIASVCGQGSAYSVDALANGGYAVSYTIPPVTSYFNRVLNGGTSAAITALVGKPSELHFSVSGASSSYAVTLRGLDGNGTLVDLALTPDSTGSVYLTESQLAQFANPERLVLRVTGLTAGSTLNISGNAFEAWNFFEDSATATTTSSVVLPITANSAITAAIGTAAGRVESFHITSMTAFSGATPTYSFSVIANSDVLQSLDLTPGTVLTVDGLTVTVLANWAMTITGAIAPDANGNIAVPAALLQALGTHDASIALVVSGLAGGSTLAADIVVRTPTVITAGVHSAIYDATGHLIADHTIDDSSAPLLTDGSSVGGHVETSALASGGYATSWVSDLDDDGTGDVIAVQRFNADGTLNGAIVKLGDLPDAAIASVCGQESAYSLDALANGGYAVSYTIPPVTSYFNRILNGGTSSALTGLVGKPTELHFAVSGATSSYTAVLRGLNSSGILVDLVLSPDSTGSVYLSDSELAQFANPERLALVVTGLVAGATLNVSGNAFEAWNFLGSEATITATSTVTLPTSTGPVTGAIGTSTGRVESFHVTSATAVGGGTPTYFLNVSTSSNVLQELGLTPGTVKTFDGLTYTVQSNWALTVTGPIAPDANGNIVVPAILLQALGTHDASIALVATGLVGGTTLAAEMVVRTPTLVSPGVYTAIYDAAGNQENFNSTSGADNLAGGIGNDVFHGGAGNDLINGRSGIDTAVFDSTRAAATIARTANHSLNVTTALDGTDTLTQIEQVRFADGLFSFKFATPNGVLVPNFNVANGWSSQDEYPRHIADVNGDGYNDIVGFGFSGVLVALGSQSGFGETTLVLSNFGKTAGWTSDNTFHRELADINGDGRADILGFGVAGTLVSLSQDNGTFASATLAAADFGTAQGWSTQSGFARTTGDVNGDGKADIIGFGQAGTLVALGNGDGTFQTARLVVSNFGVAQGWNNDTLYHRAVADVNGDGKADIVGFGQAGTYVALAKGDGTFNDAQLVLANFGAAQGWSSQDTFPRLVADVNGDGKADIVGFGANNTWVAFGLGDGTFSEASADVSDFSAAQGWSSDNTFHREIADVNHDGQLDLVGFGIAGVLAGLNQDFVI